MHLLNGAFLLSILPFKYLISKKVRKCDIILVAELKNTSILSLRKGICGRRLLEEYFSILTCITELSCSYSVIRKYFTLSIDAKSDNILKPMSFNISCDTSGESPFGKFWRIIAYDFL